MKLARIFQKVNNLGDLFFRLIAACDIGKSNRIVRLINHLGAALAEAEGTAFAAALHLAHHKNPCADQEQNRTEREQDRTQKRLLLFWFAREFNVVFEQIVDQIFVVATGDVSRFFAIGGAVFDVSAFDADLIHLAAANLFDKRRIRDRITFAARFVELLNDRKHNQADDDPDTDIFEHVIQADNSCNHIFP